MIVKGGITFVKGRRECSRLPRNKEKKTCLGKKDLTKKKNKFKRECVWAYKREKLKERERDCDYWRREGLHSRLLKEKKKFKKERTFRRDLKKKDV